MNNGLEAVAIPAEFGEADCLKKFEVFLEELRRKEKYLARLLQEFFVKAKPDMNEPELAKLIQSIFTENENFNNFLQFWKFINKQLTNQQPLSQYT